MTDDGEKPLALVTRADNERDEIRVRCDYSAIIKMARNEVMEFVRDPIGPVVYVMFDGKIVGVALCRSGQYSGEGWIAYVNGYGWCDRYLENESQARKYIRNIVMARIA